MKWSWTQAERPGAGATARRRTARAAASTRDVGQPVACRLRVVWVLRPRLQLLRQRVRGDPAGARAQERVVVHSYPGGHAIYTDDSVRDDEARCRGVCSELDDERQAFRRSTPPTQPVTARADETGDAGRQRHQISVDGRTLRYTARAGLLPIRVNETGEPHGHVFYVAYMLDNPPRADGR